MEMSEFVVTRSAQAKKNSQENFQAVTYIAPKKKSKPKDITDDGESIPTNFRTQFRNSELSKTDQNREHEVEMKRLRWDVMKFGSSGFEGIAKRDAKVALAIKLGAKPPKNRRQNYKKLMLERSKAKEAAIEEEKNRSGLSASLIKPRIKKKPRKESGLSESYGKVEKKRRK